jgi:predicted HTH transcriptional regulator
MTDISTDKLIENILQIPAEDRITELKRLGKDFNITKALESIVAMANTDGGFLIRIETGSKKTVKYRLPSEKNS